MNEANQNSKETAVQPRVLVIIPAWNEQAALPIVLADLAALPLTHPEAADLPPFDVVVVDDCSSDNTAAVAKAGGAAVLRLPINLGVGGAMRAGYRYAREHGYDYAVQLDADGQHPPCELVRLVRGIQETGVDLLLGARFAGVGDYKVTGPRWWAMVALSRYLSWICRVKLTDTTSGFKIANARAIDLLAEELPAEYLGDTIEALVIAKKAGLKIDQVGVEMAARQGGEPSHGPILLGHWRRRRSAICSRCDQ